MKIQFKPIIILLLIAISLLGGSFVMNYKKTQNSTLRVAFPADFKAQHYEPTNISIDYEYIFLENIYSTLVEVDTKGTIVPGLAERVFWEGDELHFKLKNNIKTASGKPITIDDVVFSLKRLLILSGNTHGNFKDLVCSGEELKSINQDCSGIKASGDTLILISPNRKSFLLPMLAAIDFAIIPKASVNPETLAIENYQETSGPYFVAADDEKGNIKLKLNPFHYHATNDIATEIQLIPFTSKSSSESLKALSEGRVDLLTTVDTARADEQIKFVNEHPEFTSHITQKIRSHLLVFTEKGFNSLSLEERRYIASKVRNAFQEIYGKSPGFEPREEFFPSLGEGGLTKEQLTQMEKLNLLQEQRPNKKFRLGLIRRGGIEPWANPINKNLPEAECYFENNAPDLKKNLTIEETPDAFIVSTDTGFMEDISLISYSLNAGLLGLSKKERDAWLADYMATEDKNLRLTKLKELHFNSLSQLWIAPLMASPYSATIRKPWAFNLSDLYANNQLWLIKMQ